MKLPRLSIVPVLILIPLVCCDRTPNSLPVANPKPNSAAAGKTAPVRIAPGTKDSRRGPSAARDNF
jgi:hypothetical protein